MARSSYQYGTIGRMICNQCNQDKPASDMRRAGQCKACRNAYVKANYDSEKAAKRYQEYGREAQRKRLKEKRKDPKWVEQRRHAERLKAYNLTEDEFRELVAAANGVCRICESTIDPSSFHIDHCHDTGEVRGILCRSCNLALGHLESWLKDHDKLTRAIQYLGAKYVWPA